MSYILKALKQAQESRSIDGTPVTAASQRLRSMERPRQIPWRWIAAAALVLNGLVLLLLLVLPRFGSQSPTSTAPPVTTAAPTTPVAPMAPEAPPAAVLPPRSVTAPPSAPRTVAQPPPPAVRAPGIVAHAPVTPMPPPARPAAPVQRPKPVEPKAVEPRPVEPIRPPGVAARPAERTLAEPAERPAGDRTATVAPQNQPAPVTAVVTPPPPQPQPESDAGPELRDAMSKFKLEVLVWAADPRDRMVFLSGRKFVEGQSLDGKVIVERINEDGIVLGYQGQRVRVKRP